MHSYKSKEANILLKKLPSKDNPIRLLHTAEFLNYWCCLRIGWLI